MALRAARRARCPEGGARGSGGAPRARPRAPSRARATRSARSHRAPPRPPAAAGRCGSTTAAAPAGRARGRHTAPGRRGRGRGRRPGGSARRRRGGACRAADGCASRRESRDPRPFARRAPARARSARGAAPRSRARRAARDGRAAASVPSNHASCPSEKPFTRPASSVRARRTVSTTGAAMREPVSSSVSRSRKARSKRALCATRTASPAKSRKRRTASAGRGAPRRCSFAQARDRRRAGRDAEARIDERLELVDQLELTDPDGADLADRGRPRPQSGRLEVDDDERRPLEEELGSGRLRERDRVAVPRQARVGFHDLGQERAREGDRRLAQGEQPPRRVLGGTGPRRSSTSSTSRSAASSLSCMSESVGEHTFVRQASRFGGRRRVLLVLLAVGCGGSSAPRLPRPPRQPPPATTTAESPPPPATKPGRPASTSSPTSRSRWTSTDYLDPGLSDTAEGWGVMWNVYLPLIGYKHVSGAKGATLVPYLARVAAAHLAGRPRRTRSGFGPGSATRTASRCSRATSSGRSSATSSSTPRAPALFDEHRRREAFREEPEGRDQRDPTSTSASGRSPSISSLPRATSRMSSLLSSRRRCRRARHAPTRRSIRCRRLARTRS